MGPAHAPVMLVGEQPGDQEDRQAAPSSGGPAGFSIATVPMSRVR
jgi:DNA polymerase